MQIFHLGLHKTGTTSLQKNLFAVCKATYHGQRGPAWESHRQTWLDFFTGKHLAPLSWNDNFVFSYEGTLLRSSGMSGVECLARQIAENFGDAKILITVREPSALLVSAYFNSLRLRRSAMGFRNGEPVFRESVRFMHFEEWWEKLRNSPEISLAGLLDYTGLRTALGKWLDPEKIFFLKLEEMADRSQSCSAKLLKLGFDQNAIDRLLHAPPENTGVDKKLQKERPFVFALGRKLAQGSMARPLTFALRASGLIRPAQKILYGGNYRARSGIDQKLLEDIRDEYRAAFESLT